MVDTFFILCQYLLLDWLVYVNWTKRFKGKFDVSLTQFKNSDLTKFFMSDEFEIKFNNLSEIKITDIFEEMHLLMNELVSN